MTEQHQARPPVGDDRHNLAPHQQHARRQRVLKGGQSAITGRPNTAAVTVTRAKTVVRQLRRRLTSASLSEYRASAIISCRPSSRDRG